MKDLMQLVVRKLAAAAGIYLLLFLLGQRPAFWSWLVIFSVVILFASHKRNGNKIPW